MTPNTQFLIFSFLAFLIVSNPMTYKLTNIVASRSGFPSIVGECPTRVGTLLHAIVFTLIVYVYLKSFRV